MKDISVIITTHNEGRLLHHTLRSAIKSVTYAQKKGLETEILLIVDSPDKKTRSYINNSNLIKKSSIKVSNLDVEDAGLARNHGIKESEGKYISILDGDDLYSPRWLSEAYSFAEKHKDSILHPEYSLFFGESNKLWQRKSSNTKDFDFRKLIYSNLWDALAFAPKKIFIKNLYKEVQFEAGLGCEDWLWNCETLGKGHKHLVVPNTINFIRNRKNSRGSARRINTDVPRAVATNKLFKNYISETKHNKTTNLDNLTKFNFKNFIKYNILGEILSRDFYLLGSDLKNTVISRIKPQQKNIFPRDLESILKKVRSIEPLITDENLQWYKNIPFTDLKGLKYFKLYEHIIQQIPSKSTDLIFTNVEDANINLNINLPEEEKAYIYKFPMKFNKFFNKKYEYAFLTILERLILDLSLDRIHIINNHPIIRIIEKYQDKSLIDKFFILHITKRFKDYSYFNKAFNVVSYIFVSSSEIKDDLVTIYGVKEDKIQVTGGEYE